ncbi:hypothetical protein [Mesorhizobium sp. B2-1-3]|uniref:hypothetical protein n=1 Tax=Mesorhizobium sp. B2-1-3 TaxID=2589972 RepID=UPI001127BA22|nr:hypothetical protein [Mesorhizobium sp. B2-1-3]
MTEPSSSLRSDGASSTACASEAHEASKARFASRLMVEQLRTSPGFFGTGETSMRVGFLVPA